MRSLLFLGVTLLFTLAFADHEEGYPKHDNDDHDHHDHKDSHDKKGEHHDHQHDKFSACHRIAQYNSRFSFDLYRQIVQDHPSENIVFSPISVAAALAFLSLGTKGQTHSQIMKGLRFNISQVSEQEVKEGFHNLLELLNDAEGELQLSDGSALFISKDHKIHQTFLDEAKRFYHAEAFSTDFKNTEQAKTQINSYVEKNTRGKITELLDNVDNDAILVLINYIYFRGKWEHPFEEKWTKEGDFHVNKNTTVKVPFMSRTGMYNTAFTDEVTMVEISYKGNATASLILPNEGKLSEVEQNFDTNTIKKWKKSMHRQLVDLSVPKFSISATFKLKETLSKLGIQEVFSDHADLSGITGEPKLKISKVMHKAVLTVDEKGTEAAASTAIEAVPMMLPPLITFSRPFLIAIAKTDSLLFMARILNPEK